MGSDYQFVLQRLKEERVRRNLTQRMLCYYTKMPQSHFSKAETGHKRFSYHEMKGLCASDVDVLYMFTGKKAESGQKFPEPFESGLEETICLLNTVYVLISAAWFISREKTAFEKIQMQLEYILCGSGNTGTKNNIFRYVRSRCGYTQQRMADMLGVDIKKLRELENGRLLPDSEIIWKMYDLFRISPAFILEDSKGLRSELDYVLDQLEGDDRKLILQILENVHKLIWRC